MAIICCSNDLMLLGKLFSLYGDTGVVPLAHVRLLQEKDMKEGEVLIVDIKHNKVPEGNNFSLPIIALTGIPTFTEAVLLLRYGVRGYGNRHMRQDNLDQAVKSVKAGQIWLPPAIISQLIASVGTSSTDDQPSNDMLGLLSRREREVALYVTEGMSNQQMADKMYVSLRTVKAHLSSIYGKTGLRNRLELGLCLQNKMQTV